MKQICAVRLYDADDGIFAGTCQLPRQHEGDHRLNTYKYGPNVRELTSDELGEPKVPTEEK